MQPLIDIGANLTHESFDPDRDAVLQRAREAGVVQMVVTGASREHSPLALELARRHPGELFATAGVHPHHASEYTAEWVRRPARSRANLRPVREKQTARLRRSTRWH